MPESRSSAVKLGSMRRRKRPQPRFKAEIGLILDERRRAAKQACSAKADREEETLHARQRAPHIMAGDVCEAKDDAAWGSRIMSHLKSRRLSYAQVDGGELLPIVIPTNAALHMPVSVEPNSMP